MLPSFSLTTAHGTRAVGDETIKVIWLDCYNQCGGAVSISSDSNLYGSITALAISSIKTHNMLSEAVDTVRWSLPITAVGIYFGFGKRWRHLKLSVFDRVKMENYNFVQILDILG